MQALPQLRKGLLLSILLPILLAASRLDSMMSALNKAVAAVSTPWWNGVPTRLIAKKTLVPASPGEHLPVHTLTFQIPTDAESGFAGPAVHHSQIRIDMGDVVKMVIPNYKPKSYSVSRMDDTTFDVTLKVYPNGRASGYLDRIAVGETVQSFGMHKSLSRAAAAAPSTSSNHVNIIAYGVGITEALPVAEAELEKDDSSNYVTLLWASRTLQDTFWNDRLAKLQANSRFRLQHIFSRDQQPGALQGRITPDVLRSVFLNDVDNDDDDKTIQHRFLSVGTKEMMRQTDEMLASIGFPQPKYALFSKTSFF